jgi:hypothetical protein
MRVIYLTAPLLLLAAYIIAQVEQAPSFEFTKVADFSTPSPGVAFTHFETPRSLGDGSTVFVGSYATNLFPGFGVFLNDGARNTTIAKTGEKPFNVVVGRPSKLIVSGKIVHMHFGAKRILAFRDGKLSDPMNGDAEGTSGERLTRIVDFDANESSIVFTGEKSGIYIWKGGKVSSIAQRGEAGPFGKFLTFSSPSVNGSAVAFLADSESGNALYVWDSGRTKVIARSGDTVPTSTIARIESSSLSEYCIAFTAQCRDGHMSLFVHNDGQTLQIARTEDRGVPGSISSVCARGRHVSYYLRAGGKPEIRLFDGSSSHKVIGVGNTLFGGEVDGISADCHQGDDGSIAFEYHLKNVDNKSICLARPRRSTPWIAMAFAGTAALILVAQLWRRLIRRALMPAETTIASSGAID